ncbi:hypothetical protein [Dapis sp. BLCC M229]
MYIYSTEEAKAYMATGSTDKKISVVPQVQRPEDVKSSNFLLRLL